MPIGAAIGSAVAGVGGALISSSSQNHAADTAAQTSAQNTAATNALLTQLYAANTANETPYLQSGYGAQSTLDLMLGIQPQTASQFNSGQWSAPGTYQPVTQTGQPIPTAPAAGGGATGGAYGGGSPAPLTGTSLWDSYLSSNPDVAANYANVDHRQFPTPESYAQWHYAHYGQNEGRQLPTSATTSTAATAQAYNPATTANPTLAAALGTRVPAIGRGDLEPLQRTPQSVIQATQNGGPPNSSGAYYNPATAVPTIPTSVTPQDVASGTQTLPTPVGTPTPVTTPTPATGTGTATGSPAPTASSITDMLRNTPGYQFALKQGEDAINANAYARNIGNSGVTYKALETYGQNVADGQYQQYLDNLSRVASGGASAAGALAGVSQNYGNNVTTAMQNNALAQSQAAAAHANATGTLTSGITGAVGTLAGSPAIQNLFGSSYTPSSGGNPYTYNPGTGNYNVGPINVTGYGVIGG